MAKPLCIYHGNCADGFTSAWVVRKALGDVDFHAGVHQALPPDVEGRDVLLVDFCYPWAVLESMADKARSILVLDHHKSAADDLRVAGVPNGCSGWDQHLARVRQDRREGVARSLYAVFDMDRSGARVTWDFFFNSPPPQLLLHIEDRDLWRFAMPKTREIQANIFSYPYDFEIWDRLMAADPQELAKEGEAIERKHLKDIDELLGVVTRRLTIGGHSVPAANLPYTLAPDAASRLAQGEPFAACYWDTPERRVFSLRSTPEGLDVSEIARHYGGGGHRNAAGFRVPHDECAQFERATVPTTNDDPSNHS